MQLRPDTVLDIARQAARFAGRRGPDLDDAASDAMLAYYSGALSTPRKNPEQTLFYWFAQRAKQSRVGRLALFGIAFDYVYGCSKHQAKKELSAATQARLSALAAPTRQINPCRLPARESPDDDLVSDPRFAPLKAALNILKAEQPSEYAAIEEVYFRDTPPTRAARDLRIHPDTLRRRLTKGLSALGERMVTAQ